MPIAQVVIAHRERGDDVAVRVKGVPEERLRRFDGDDVRGEDRDDVKWVTAVVVEPILDDRCLLYTSPSPRDKRQSRMPSSA